AIGALAPDHRSPTARKPDPRMDGPLVLGVSDRRDARLPSLGRTPGIRLLFGRALQTAPGGRSRRAIVGASQLLRSEPSASRVDTRERLSRLDAQRLRL